MEAHRFESPESPDSSELVDDAAPVAKNKKKKKSGRTTGIAGKAERSDKAQEAPPKTELIESSKTLWQRLVGESAETDKKSAEVKHTDDAEAMVDHENGAHDEALPLEALTEEEKLLAIEQYIIARQQELAQEAATDTIQPVDAEAAAANQTFLQVLRARLQRQPAETIGQASAAAYAEAVESAVPEEVEAVALPAATAENQAEPFAAGTVVSVRPPATHEAAPAPRPFVASSAAETMPDKQAATGSALLAGGVIGYLIGRRRGRIKTEKRLQPIQQKLEKEVAAVQAIVTQKEAAIRTLVRERHMINSESTPVKSTPEVVKARPVAVKRQEKLGLVTLQAIEKAPPTTTKKEVNVPETTLQAADMSRGELLAASGEITVGATTLRQVYETKLISERALRRLVHEHQRGGDVRRILREEMLAKELSYERDPRLRDQPLSVSPRAAATGQVQPVVPVMPAAPSVVATPRPSAAPATAVPHKKPGRSTKRQSTASPALVAANVTALIILAILLIVLVITRRTHQL